MGSATLAALELQAAREERERSQAALEATIRKLREEERTVAQPLRRTHQRMLEHNHVFDSIRSQIRGEG
jgi:hypothetical protein